MADIEYSDDLLATSENLGAVDWDGIEGGGKLSPGTHLCVVKKIGGYLHNFKNYTGPRAKVFLQVIDGPDKGKTQYDDITLPHPMEADGSRNRRVLIGSRMGLLQKGSKDTAKVNWKVLEGRLVLVTVEDVISEKNGKTYSNVKYDGWQDPAVVGEASAAAQAGAGVSGGAAKDAYSDI